MKNMVQPEITWSTLLGLFIVEPLKTCGGVDSAMIQRGIFYRSKSKHEKNWIKIYCFKFYVLFKKL